MDFFIKESNVRPGNRGGRSYFKWDDVRLMDNKNREAYLGVSQCIGFLDKGGKWRKRDWWQNFNPDEKKVSKLELSKIKEEEEDKLYEAVYGKKKVKNENPNKKLTDFQWEKLTKKEGKKGLNDFDYYYDDKHRAGLGINTTMSFRANPYNNNENLGRLEGNLNENNIQENKEEKDEIKEKKIVNENSNLGKFIDEYLNKKRKISDDSKPKKEENKKKSHKHRHHHHHHSHRKKK
jgi:hypothetical protein